jgi:uncharacterized protein (DUF1778 family)
MRYDLRIPLTDDQKILIHRAAHEEQSDVASWARPILLKAAQNRVKHEEKKSGRQD